jgi:hypothetical protein
MDIYVLHELVDVRPMAVLPRLLGLLEHGLLEHGLLVAAHVDAREDRLYTVK